MKLIPMFVITAALVAPVAMAQTEPAPGTEPMTPTTEPVHVWNPEWWGNHFQYCATAPNKYSAHEGTFDLFASYVAREEKISHLFQTDIRDGVWGGGVGGNYFFTRELGIGADVNMPHDGGNLINNVNGSLIARFPIEPTGLAPYVFGGGGRTTDRVWDWTGHAGVGLEYRMNPITGIFVDGRYVWGDKTSDSVLFRTGFRFAF